jgi:16S rRNA (adenine1518-N6/adenine1519-N6)-dimethyltransferase
MSLYEENKEIMRKYNIAPQKKYGQNFLIDDFALDKIIENADIKKDDLVIEIGPGLGNLTKRLCEKAKNVLAIEIDSNMVKILETEYSHLKNLIILNEDIMKVDLKSVISNINGINDVKVVANLPYYITTPIIMKLLEDNAGISLIEVMIQKEVAERLCAKPTGREYGAITVAVNYYSEPNYIVTVPSKSFLPAPDVDSAVVRLNIYDKPRVNVNKELFFQIVKAAFSQKRKTLLNSLGNAKINGIDKEMLAKFLEELNIDLNIRAERLSLEDFANISNKYLR